MKLFTKTIPVTAFALTAILSAWPVAAQSQEGPKRDPQKMTERRISRLKHALNLNADQEAQVRTIFSDNAKQLADLRQKYANAERGKPTPEMRADLKNLREETHAKLAKVLDETQMKKYDAMAKFRGRRGHGPGHQEQPQQDN